MQQLKELIEKPIEKYNKIKDNAFGSYKNIQNTTLSKEDFQLLFPKIDKVYHNDEYFEEDDIYNNLLSNEDKKQYGIC